ncbi:SDR family oxidoreductase [Marinomonas ostreistagni]|uniref:SDR family oxidoreductase n=1 Tax=Marinomonas ostreistagni TaxID=359209 RepID=UPI00194F80E3|nr:SDR family oxidoreductase [Marinomonas ostreistagni]MBM6551585.1 SDR family oxidoreductase [Marinomonas ostreistagni]
MNTILVIGATGQVGQKVCQKLAYRGYQVRALVRDLDKATEIQHSNVELFQANLEDDFSDAFDGVQKVVFVAGSGADTGFDKTVMIDLWAARRAVDYAEEEPSVEHFVLLSSYGAHDPEDMDGKIKPYIIAKHLADEYLMDSTVPHTILRPGPLTDEPAQNGFSNERPDSLAFEDMQISRADVAEALYFCVEQDCSKVKVIELFSGHASPYEAICLQ